MIKIKISTDFSPTPGARTPEEGPYSGQEFRQKHLEPLFADKNNTTPIEIDLDGTYGYAPSFLEEAFGGLARHLSDNSLVRTRFTFVSTEEPDLIEDIQRYIKDYLTGGRRR